MPPARRFLTAEEYGARPAGPGQPAIRSQVPIGRAAEWVVRVHWSRADFTPFLPDPSDTDNDHATVAAVNRARWVARCPFCPGAQLVHPADPRLFCVDCLCEAGGFRWVPVVWPADPAEIEAVLAPRPTDVCNWEPPETAEMLRAENALMGWGS